MSLRPALRKDDTDTQRESIKKVAWSSDSKIHSKDITRKIHGKDITRKDRSKGLFVHPICNVSEDVIRSQRVTTVPWSSYAIKSAERQPSMENLHAAAKAAAEAALAASTAEDYDVHAPEIERAFLKTPPLTAQRAEGAKFIKSRARIRQKGTRSSDGSLDGSIYDVRILSSKTQSDDSCTNCGAKVPPNLENCGDCGLEVPWMDRCVYCGAELPPWRGFKR
jgi:hypothetical protein